MARIVVIGAGMGGLAVAARLAVKRHDVTVIESATEPGGLVRDMHHEGFTFPLGPAQLTLPAVYRDLFLKTGDALERSIELVPIDPATTYHFPDGTRLALPGAGVGRCVSAIGAALGAEAAAHWRSLMTSSASAWTTTRQAITSPAPAEDSPRSRTRHPRSLAQLAAEAMPDDRLRAVLLSTASRFGITAGDAPSALALLPYVESTFGVWHVAGGIQRLAAALAERAEERGATIYLSTTAAEIEMGSGRVTGVRVVRPDGTHQTLPADLVVADIDDQALSRLVSRHDDADRRRGRTDHPLRGRFQLLLAVRGATPGIGWSNIWFPPTAGSGSWFPRKAGLKHPARGRHATPRLNVGASRDASPTIHADVPDDPLMRPPGHEAWRIWIDVPGHSPGALAPGTLDWDSDVHTQRCTGLILQRLREHGIPIESRILWQQVHTPADQVRARSARPGILAQDPANQPPANQRSGDQRSAPVDPDQHRDPARSLDPRPAPRRSGRLPVDPLPGGLLRVGSSVHPGPGLPLVALSAEILAEQIGRARG